MALNKTLPGLALLRVQSSTLGPKSTQMPFHTPQVFILLAASTQQLTQREIFSFLYCATV